MKKLLYKQHTRSESEEETPLLEQGILHVDFVGKIQSSRFYIFLLLQGFVYLKSRKQEKGGRGRRGGKEEKLVYLGKEKEQRETK